MYRYIILSEIYCTHIEFRCGEIIMSLEREREEVLYNDININISCISWRKDGGDAIIVTDFGRNPIDE